MQKNFEYYTNLPWEFIFDKAEEGGYNARVEGLSCFSWGETLKEAADNIQEALEIYIKDSLEENFPIPEPTIEDVSGKINIRTKKSTHLKLIKISKNEGVSVSHLVNDAITKIYG